MTHSSKTLRLLLIGTLLASVATIPAAALPQSAEDQPSEDGMETLASPVFEPGFRQARRHRGPRHGAGFHPLRRAMVHLDLSETQRAEIRAIFESEHDEFGSKRRAVRTLSQELKTQIGIDPYDETAIRQKAEELASLRVEMAVTRARQLGDVLALLTPEQRDDLEEMRQRRKAFREQRAERWQTRRRTRQRP